MNANSLPARKKEVGPSMALTVSLIALMLIMPNERRFNFSPLPAVNTINMVFLICAGFYLAARKHFKSPSRPAPSGNYILFFWLVSFMALVNGMTMGDVPPQMSDLVAYKNHVFYMGLYFLYFHAIRDRKTLDRVYWALLVIVALGGLEAVRQYMSLGATSYSVNARVSGPFGEGWQSSNTAGVFFAQFAPVIFAELLFQRHKLLRLGLVGMLGVTVLGLFYTYSRKSYYALAAALTVTGASASKLVLIPIAAVVLSFPAWAPDSAVERLFGSEEEQQAQAMGDEAKPDESTESRFILWEGAMRMWHDHPLGVGFERFKHHIGNYSAISNLDAHNYYVLLLAEMGPLGEFAFLLMLFMLYREGAKLSKVAKAPRERALATGFRGALLAMAVANTFGSAFNFGNMMGNFWVLFALVVRMRCLIEEERKPQQAALAAAARRRMMA